MGANPQRQLCTAKARSSWSNRTWKRRKKTCSVITRELARQQILGVAITISLAEEFSLFSRKLNNWLIKTSWLFVYFNLISILMATYLWKCLLNDRMTMWACMLRACKIRDHPGARRCPFVNLLFIAVCYLSVILNLEVTSLVWECYKWLNNSPHKWWQQVPLVSLSDV